MIDRGSRLTLDIEKPAAGGRMLARHAGQVVLVAGTIPGERVRARVERVGKGVAFAETEDVLAPSADRRAGMHDWRCGGTVYAHVAYPRQLQLKAEIIQDAFVRIGRLPLGAPVAVTGSPESGYRMRARLHVSGSRTGFFREGTHEICDAGTTGQLAPASLDWIAATSRSLASVREGQGESGIAAIELSENVAGDERAAHLELHARVKPDAYRGLAEGLVGLSAHAADAHQPTVLAGVPVITDHVDVGVDGSARGRLTLTRDVRAFFQGNRFLLQPLVSRVVDLVGGEAPVFDLYAGVGLFGLAAATMGVDDITLVEGDPISGSDLARNAAPFGTRVRVHRQSVEMFLRRGTRGSADTAGPTIGAAGTVIVDPPRTGVSREALTGIVKGQPRRIVYVSCDVATLARDARTLVDAGWELTEVSALDLFPNTAHVETIAVFRR